MVDGRWSMVIKIFYRFYREFQGKTGKNLQLQFLKNAWVSHPTFRGSFFELRACASKLNLQQDIILCWCGNHWQAVLSNLE